jgi:hypothetical protein
MPVDGYNGIDGGVYRGSEHIPALAGLGNALLHTIGSHEGYDQSTRLRSRKPK